MAAYADRDIDSVVERYFDLHKDGRYLYQCSYERIVDKLRDWVPRQIAHNQKLMAAREKSLAMSEATLASSRGDCSGPAPANIAETIKHVDYVYALDKATKLDNMRAMYLLDALRHRGFTWPEVGYLPEFDGGVCSFLGTIDSTFDVESTLVILDDKEHVQRSLAKRAEIPARLAGPKLSEGNPASKPPTNPEEEVDLVPNEEADPVLDKEERVRRAKTKARAKQRKNAKAKKAFEDWAMEALGGNQYPGVCFFRGKIRAIGVDKDDCHARLETFVKAELGAGVRMEDVMVENAVTGDGVVMVYTPHKAEDTGTSTDDGTTPAPASAKPPPPVPQQVSKKRPPHEN